MTGYIGTLANLLPVIPTESVSVEPTDEAYTLQKSPDKVWAFVNGKASKRRVWDVDTRLLSRPERGALMELSQGAWGAGPFVYVGCEAHDANVLTPDQSALVGVANGGVMQCTNGSAPSSLVGGKYTVLADFVPVVPGKPLTVTVDTAGATTLTVTFKNSSGGTVATKSTTAKNVLLQRLSTVVPMVPSDARYVTVTASSFTALARPQVTWTNAVVPWSAGMGAASVVVQQDKYSFAGRGFFGTSLQIVEVG